MAATDKHYRDQHSLDIVFALSSVAMLVGMILMLVQDFQREYKVEQRVFRDVEVAMAQRAALDKLPDDTEFRQAKQEVELEKRRRELSLVRDEQSLTKKELQKTEKELEAAMGKGAKDKVYDLEQQKKAQEARLEYLAHWEKLVERVPQARKTLKEKAPERDRKEIRFQTIKSDMESRGSFYDIEVEHHGDSALAQTYWKEIKDLSAKLEEAKADREITLGEIRQAQGVVDEYEAPLIRATTKLKKLSDQFDAQVKTAASRAWGVDEWIRGWPILDAFASPVKIHQYVIDDVPIDFNFKYVTRFDRCATCHLGIAREDYTRENLLALRGVTNEQDIKLNLAKQKLRERREALKGLPEYDTVPDPDKLDIKTLSPDVLTDARITEFCAHPRLDLFVGPTSKHPAEKFGCSSCHQGQGSATSFTLASHAPNSSDQEREWKKKYAWEANHYWDFPMLPKRFTESSCLKCHHEVTDLVSSDNRVEAPKLLKGFHTIQDVGCFGCHEIQGRKGGRAVGPDLRLESSPPLEELEPGQRALIEGDPETAPGNYRKVGPSLFRLSEKTNEDFVRKWIYSPRSFRPDTKMPHYYNLETNHKDVLPEDQKAFPETEVYAITRFLFKTSNGYLNELKELKLIDLQGLEGKALENAEQRNKEKDSLARAEKEYFALLKDFLDSKATMTPARLEGLEKAVAQIEAAAAKVVSEKDLGKVPGIRLKNSPLDSNIKFFAKIRQGLAVYGGKLPTDENREAAKAIDEELREVSRRIKMREKVPLLGSVAAGVKGDEARGRLLFTTKGCMACHVHDATAVPQGDPADKNFSPAFTHDADFGPSLSQVVEKLIDKGGMKELELERAKVQEQLKPLSKKTSLTPQEKKDMEGLGKRLQDLEEKSKGLQKNGRPMAWLVQWLRDPTAHSPRSRMPNTHLSVQEAVDIASWLLSHKKGMDISPEWWELEVNRPSMDNLRALARVYLGPLLPRSDLNPFLDEGKPLPAEQVNGLPIDEKWLAQELNLAAGIKDRGQEEKNALREERLLEYLGKKAVNRLGCYGCHDIPGFENAKPIGVALNDWGKKPADRLAFEDIKNFVKKHYHIVDDLKGEDGKPLAPHLENGATHKNYERFYADALFHHTREGYLNQKLLAPRSYDYNRKRSWVDRYRMPQFKFSKFRIPAQVKADFALADLMEKVLGQKEKLTVSHLNQLLDEIPEEGSPHSAYRDEDLLPLVAEALEAVKDKTTVPLPDATRIQVESVLRSKLIQLKAQLPDKAALLGQADYQEDQAREAVATFILGLVAEPVPMQSINQPKGDRAAEVKGRQVLEKFNCQSCHLIRPGYFEFKATGPVVKYLEETHGKYLEAVASKTFQQPGHYFWTGEEPPNGRIRAMVGWPTFKEFYRLRPLEALRFQDTDRTLRDIGTAEMEYILGEGGIPIKDMVFPEPRHFSSPDKLQEFLQTHGPFGGTFGDALASYLVKQTEKSTAALNYENARSSAPPYLLAQGEKTQPEWLYQFLLHPVEIRKMAVLRMPQFNMSREEARVLVEYFSAVERINNPGLGLTAPFEDIRQKEGLNSDYWRQKNEAYINRLGGNKSTLYKQKVAELTPVWDRIIQDFKDKLETAGKRVKEAQKEFDPISEKYGPLEESKKKLEKELETLKADAAKAKANAARIKELTEQIQADQKKIDALDPEYQGKKRILKTWQDELDFLQKQKGMFTPAEMEKDWAANQAYLSDAFRLLTHQNLCAQCHQVGERPINKADPGPNLTMAHQRLRPGWIERWVTNPKFYLHYTPMPPYFYKGKLEHQNYFVGDSLEQIQAVRDLLMVYPQVSALPLNRYWVLPPAAVAAAGKEGPAKEDGKGGEGKDSKEKKDK